MDHRECTKHTSPMNFSNYSDLTRPGLPKGSFLEGKMGPRLFQKNSHVGEILFHLAPVGEIWLTS